MKAVIFDCDGTLVDSEPLARRAWERSLAPHGYTLGEEYEALVGLPYARVHAFFAERIGGIDDAGAFWDAYSAELFELIDAELEPFADAVETVAALREAGVAVAVASSSKRVRLDRTLRRARLQFGVTVAGDEVAHGKPAPDMFLAAASRLGLEPASCAVVEDSAPGVEAGLAAGMRTVAILREGNDAGALAGAHVVLERLSAEAVLAA